MPQPTKKPLLLYLIAAGYLGAMVLNMYQIYSWGRDIYVHDVVFTILYPVAAYGIFKVRRWGWYLVVGHIIFLVAGNVVLAVQYNYYDDVLLLQLNLLLVFFLWYFLRKSVRSPFHNPALRWWERQHPRYGATFKVTLRNEAGDTLIMDGVNLSIGGCFVKLADDDSVAMHDHFDVELKYEHFDTFRAKGQVTWLTERSELNPKGAGIAFARPDRANRLLLKSILRMVESRWVKSAEGAPAQS
ncbi:MAG: PilZ domain-containing protein [Acidiferrobacterales bacterium]